MNQQLIEIGIRRGQLIERIAAQRASLGQRVQPVRRSLKVADHVRAVVRSGASYVKNHLGTTAAVITVLVALKPRRAWRWGRRAFVAWRTWRALREQVEALESRR